MTHNFTLTIHCNVTLCFPDDVTPQVIAQVGEVLRRIPEDDEVFIQAVVAELKKRINTTDLEVTAVQNAPCEHDYSYAVYPGGKCRKCGACD